MAVSTHYGSHQAIFRMSVTNVLVNTFDVGCPGLWHVHKLESALKNMVYPMLHEGLEKMHGPFIFIFILSAVDLYILSNAELDIRTIITKLTRIFSFCGALYSEISFGTKRNRIFKITTKELQFTLP